MRISIYSYTNDKIPAIKALRAITGWGLKDAKEAIDTVGDGGIWVLEDINQAQTQVLRNAGILFEVENESEITDIADVIDGLKESVPKLLDLKAYKAAQYLIDAIEELEHEEY